MGKRHITRRRLSIVWLASALLGLIVAGCGSAVTGGEVRESPAASVPPLATSPGRQDAAAATQARHTFAGMTLELVAQDRGYSASHFAVDAGEPFEVRFENRDPFKHAFYIVVGPVRPKQYSETDLAGMSAFRGDYISGPATTTYHVAALPSGIYSFFCPVHQAMVGTISVLDDAARAADERGSGR